MSLQTEIVRAKNAGTERMVHFGVKTGSGKGVWFPLLVIVELGVAVAATWN